MVPQDYLSFPYFNKWCATQIALILDNDVATVEDFLEQVVNVEPVAASQAGIEAIVEENRGWEFSYKVPSDIPAAYAVGQMVRTQRHMHAGHTRLPRYARDVIGEVIAQHGCHPLADQSAHGSQEPQHLYTVRFEAQTLWGGRREPTR